MLANISDPLKTKLYLYKPSHTPFKQPKNRPTYTRSHKSFVKDNQQKLTLMLQINHKYQHQLVNHQFHKFIDLERYSPKKFLKNFKDQSTDNLTPIKLRNIHNSKDKISIKKLIDDAPPTILPQTNFALFGRKCTQKRIIQNQSSLPEVPSHQIRISRFVEDSWIKNPNEPLTGYWIPLNQLVSLFPVNNRKIDKVPVINQPYILPMLGCLTVRNEENKVEKFIVTELYNKNSLRDILNEFQSLSEETVKGYLRKIILCVWNLHKNRIAHNRLTLDSFVTTQDGEILLNMLKSSTKPLTEKQRFEETYNFPPEMLLSRTNYDSMKNDIWAIGCIALELLTGYEPKANSYHPYNQYIERQDWEQNCQSPKTTKITTLEFGKRERQSRFMSSFEVSRMSSEFNIMKDSSSILQKIRKLIESESNSSTMPQSEIWIDMCQSIMLKDISVVAADFTKRCLNIKLQKRPSIDELMFHAFLK